MPARVVQVALVEVHGIPLLGVIGPALLGAVPRRAGDRSGRKLVQGAMSFGGARVDDGGRVHLFMQIPDQFMVINRESRAPNAPVELARRFSARSRAPKYQAAELRGGQSDLVAGHVMVAFEQIPSGGCRRSRGYVRVEQSDIAVEHA